MNRKQKKRLLYELLNWFPVSSHLLNVNEEKQNSQNGAVLWWKYSYFSTVSLTTQEWKWFLLALLSFEKTTQISQGRISKLNRVHGPRSRSWALRGRRSREVGVRCEGDVQEDIRVQKKQRYLLSCWELKRKTVGRDWFSLRNNAANIPLLVKRVGECVEGIHKLDYLNTRRTIHPAFRITP